MIKFSLNQSTSRTAEMNIKNAVKAEDHNLSQMKRDRWLALDAQLRVGVKTHVINMLRDPAREVAKAASIALAYIGTIELAAVSDAAPAGAWPELSQMLHDNVTTVAAQVEGSGAGPLLLDLVQDLPVLGVTEPGLVRQSREVARRRSGDEARGCGGGWRRVRMVRVGVWCDEWALGV